MDRADGDVEEGSRITLRVRTVAFDLFRHDLLRTLRPLTDDDSTDVVDQVNLPLVQPLASP